MALNKTRARRLRIKKGIRDKISGTAEKPRLSIYRSNRGIYAQLINDVEGKTLAYASPADLDAENAGIDGCKTIGKLVAERAVEKGVKNVVFDRAGYKYHGRVKALAEGAREGGLIF